MAEARDAEHDEWEALVQRVGSGHECEVLTEVDDEREDPQTQLQAQNQLMEHELMSLTHKL